MDFKQVPFDTLAALNAGPSRDLLYLASLLFGIALGIFLVSRRKGTSLRRRAGLISALLCFIALALASLAGALIFSGGMIFSVAAFYPLAGLFLSLGVVAACFPRAGACPLILAAGLFSIWICFTFLVYPRFEEPERLSLRSGGGSLILFRLHGGSGKDTETWDIRDNGSPLTFEAASVTAHPAYPLIGGERRGLILRARRDNEQLFAFTRNLYRLDFPGGGLGFSLNKYNLELPPGTLLPGMSLSVLFDGEKLYFDPPIRL
ncbi:MAG: hypothetical protein LBC31_03270 [Treponema sp.]|jgi:uncharacterized membrane protein|nr:hypothetical protein [Treponema sp.]